MKKKRVYVSPDSNWKRDADGEPYLGDTVRWLVVSCQRDGEHVHGRFKSEAEAEAAAERMNNA